MSELVLECYKKVGLEATVRFLDNLKNLGFYRSDQSCPFDGCLRCRIPANKAKDP